jgi:hypothetical protein
MTTASPTVAGFATAVAELWIDVDQTDEANPIPNNA